MSGDVTYQRIGYSGVTTMKATIGRSDSEQAIEGEFVSSASKRDYILRSADLLVATVFEPPRPGDRITETVTGAVYEVCEEGLDRCWRFSDEFGQAVRVRTKMVSVGSTGLH